LKPFDDGGFNLSEFTPGLRLDRHSLKVTSISDEGSPLCAVREVATVAPSRPAVGGKVTRKNRVRHAAAEVVP
jgi:hypothetical protein